MSYRVRYTMPNGKTGHWMRDYATHEAAQRAIDGRVYDTGFTYTVEEVPDAPEPKPEPGSMAAHHFEILRTRVNVLEALAEARGKAVTDAHIANLAMHRDLALAIQLGDALRQAMRTGEWRPGHDRNVANSARTGWDRFRPSLGKAPSASEAPGEGGDSDRRRLEVLERFLGGDTFRQIWKTTQGNIVAGTTIEGQEYAAPTIAALADKLAEKEGKP